MENNDARYLKRAQVRLDRQGIKLSSAALRKLKDLLMPEVDLNEDTFEAWFEHVLSIETIYLDHASELIENYEIKKEVNQGDTEEEAVDTSAEEVIDTEDYLHRAVEQAQLDLTEEDMQTILKGLKKSFTSKQECVDSIIAAVESYMANQEAKRAEILQQNQTNIQQNLVNSETDLATLERSLANYKDKNYELFKALEVADNKFKSLTQVRNGMLVIFLVGTLLAVFGIPFVMKQQKEAYHQQIQDYCEAGELSHKYCPQRVKDLLN